MLATLAAALFSGLPVAVVLMGVGFIFGGAGMLIGAVRLSDFGAIYFRVYGSLADSDDILYASVPLLVFMGATLQRAGLATDLLAGVQGIVRGVPGGLAVAVVLLGAVLAPTAGVIGASVTALGLIALPFMLQQGYRPADAAGVVAAAGTLGVIVPPGIMLFFIADATGVQVPAIFLGMLGPLALLLACYVAFALVALRPAGNAPSAGSVFVDQASQRASAWRLMPPLLLIAAVLLSIALGWTTLSESAALGAFGAASIAALQSRLSLADLDAAIRQTILTTGMVFFIFIGASVFSLVFRLLGGNDLIVGALTSLHLGATGTLLCILLIVFALGFFFDWLEIVLVTFPILRPLLEALDFGTHLAAPHLAVYWIAVLLALNLQTSFLTPPFGFALFLLKSVAPPGIGLAEVYRGILPYVLMQIFVMAVVIACPAIATWLPDQLFDLSLPRGGKFKE